MKTSRSVKIKDNNNAIFYIKTKDPYDEGRNLFKSSTPTIHPGITLLVGCNGAGKTAMIKCMKEALRRSNYDYYYYDNYNDNMLILDNALSNSDFKLASEKMLSSEGQNIIINIATCMNDVCDYGDKMISADKPIFIFFDGVDSGLSIDNIQGVKWFFHELYFTKWNKYPKCYIVLTANSFEMVKDEWCYNVQTASYTSFSDYEKFCNFVLKSRKRMDKDIEKLLNNKGEDE